MKRKLRTLACMAAVSCICTMSFSMPVHAASVPTAKSVVAASTAKSKVLDHLKQKKENLHNKIDQDIANLVNLKLGDVGSVDVGTWDDIDVNLDNVNVNININFGNIIIGNRN